MLFTRAAKALQRCCVRRGQRSVNTRCDLTDGAMAAAASMTLDAQAPQSAPTPQSPDRPQPDAATQVPNRAMPANATITISGCLKEEKDVAGLKPSAVERAGITEDYVLTDVKMSPSEARCQGIGVSTEVRD